MSKEHRHSLDRDAGQQQFDAECIPPAVGVTVLNVGEFVEFFERALVISHAGFLPSLSGPKVIVRRSYGVGRGDRRGWERDADICSSLRSS